MDGFTSLNDKYLTWQRQFEFIDLDLKYYEIYLFNINKYLWILAMSKLIMSPNQLMKGSWIYMSLQKISAHHANISDLASQ